MDLKYYDNDQWISLKTVCGESVEDSTSVNDDSTFATPKYIINNLVEKKDGNFVKYYDGTILNEKIEIDTDVETKDFISKIELNNTKKEGTTILTPTYGEIVESTESTPSGNIVSNISFNSGNLEVAKGKLSDNLLSLISSGPDVPDDKTKGFFYLQTEGSSNSDISA